jgi:ComF family protein
MRAPEARTVAGVLDLLLPQRCLGCSLPGRPVCDSCRSSIRRIEPPLCTRCGAPTAWPVERCAECTRRRLAFVRARAAVAYDEPVRRIVAAWKERGLRRLAGWTAELVVAGLAPIAVDCVTFVPPDRDRVLRRGHHPAEALAGELALRWSLDIHALLRRTRRVRPQRGLTRLERRCNLSGAFESRAPPRSVLVVDDVYTTGATANAAASALRAAGARRVEVVTFARVIRFR